MVSQAFKLGTKIESQNPNTWAPVLQSAERAVLKTVQFGFESQAGHMAKKNYVGLQAVNVGFDAHLTLIYTGSMTKNQEVVYTEIIEEAVGKRMKYHVFNMDRKRIEMFGENHDIPVITLYPHTAITSLRRSLLAAGIPNRADYPWNPHITIRPRPQDTIEIPPKIRLTGLSIY